MTRAESRLFMHLRSPRFAKTLNPVRSSHSEEAEVDVEVEVEVEVEVAVPRGNTNTLCVMGVHIV